MFCNLSDGKLQLHAGPAPLPAVGFAEDRPAPGGQLQAGALAVCIAHRMVYPAAACPCYAKLHEEVSGVAV